MSKKKDDHRCTDECLTDSTGSVWHEDDGDRWVTWNTASESMSERRAAREASMKKINALNKRYRSKK